MRVMFLAALLCLSMALVKPPKDPHCEYMDKNITKYTLTGTQVKVFGKNGCSKECKCIKKTVATGFLGLDRKTIGELECSSCKGGRCEYVDADGSIKSVTTGMSYQDKCNTCKCLESGASCTKKACPLTCTYKHWDGLNKYVQAGHNKSLNVLGENGCRLKCMCVKKNVGGIIFGIGSRTIGELDCEERCYKKKDKGDRRKKRKERKKRKGRKKRKQRKKRKEKRKGKGEEPKGDKKD